MHQKNSKKISPVSIFLFFCFSTLLFISHSNAGVLLQGFYWDAYSPNNNSWWDYLADQSESLAESGFTAVWIPPVLKGASGGYSNGYDPYDDYDLGSKDQKSTYGTHWGTRTELMRSVAMMRANGLDVYFDNVLGHRSGDNGQGRFIYKDAYNNPSGGRFEKDEDSFFGYNSFGRQLNYLNPSVENNLIQAGDWLMNALGVQGMRIDMATNVSPNFLNKYLHTGAMTNKFTVSEYWSENLNELEHYVMHEMQGRVSAFDFPLWGSLKDMTNSGGFYDLRQLISAGLNSRQPNHAVTFVENHDTDRGFPTKYNKHLAYAFILTTEGYPSVFWKDYFQYGLKQIIDPLIWIHEKFAFGKTIWHFADEDLLIYERDSDPGLIVGLNDNQVFEKSQWIQTKYGAFVQLHDYTGNGPDIKTEADGRVEIKVPANSYVAYSVAGFHWGHSLQSYRTNQQFAGANELDIPPATTEKFQHIGKIYAKKGSQLTWSLFLGSIQYENINSKSGIKNTLNTSESINLAIKNNNQKTIFNQTSSAHANTQTENLIIPETGWYEFEIKIISKDNVIKTMPYWLNVSYMAPKKL
jgi:alpha-amylase